MRGIKFLVSLDGEFDAIADPSKLVTLEGKPLEKFITEVPIANLTPGLAEDIKILDFEKLSEQMEELKARAVSDEDRIRQLESLIENAKKPGGLLENVFQKVGNRFSPSMGGLGGQLAAAFGQQLDGLVFNSDRLLGRTISEPCSQTWSSMPTSMSGQSDFKNPSNTSAFNEQRLPTDSSMLNRTVFNSELCDRCNGTGKKLIG